MIHCMTKATINYKKYLNSTSNSQSHPLLCACPTFWHTLQCVLSAVPPRDTERPAPSASSARRVRDSQPARTKFIHPKVSRVCHERALLQSEREEERVHSFFRKSTATTGAIQGGQIIYVAVRNDMSSNV